jgi:hypothetical protein
MELMELKNGGAVVFDVSDTPLVALYSWQRFDHRKQQYAITWVKLEKGWRMMFMHRYILGLKPGDGIKVDHIDGNGLNNQRNNLRPTTNSQNLQNRHTLDRNNRSGYRNVAWDNERTRWIVTIRVNNKNIHVGRYDDLLEANEAAIQARRTYMTHCPEALS